MFFYSFVLGFALCSY